MPNGSLPLAGILVVALEQAAAGPLCTRHLGDLGADVIKVERPPDGDLGRHYDTVAKGNAAYFAWLNRNKRSILLDLKQPEDYALFEAMLARADVFLHNLGPGAVGRLGFGWETIHQRWPRLISCGISGYGMDGPYRDRKAFDLLLQGESGITSITGSADKPAKVGVSIADISAGMYAMSSILLALYERERTGEGRFIDISMLDCLAEWVMGQAYFQLYDGAPPARTGMRHNIIVPYGPYRVGDGAVVNLAVQNEGQWQRLCAVVLRRPELAQDPRFCTNALRLKNRTVLEPLIEEALADDTRAAVVKRLEAADVPYGDVNDLADLLAHPQLAERGRWLEVGSEGGQVQALAHPFNLLGMPQRADPIPALGQHTEEIRREFGGG
jgi:crotonobetainyl-CoA:carnitine CoA-transferase CaiB-like acyl-CoA transferase